MKRFPAIRAVWTVPREASEDATVAAYTRTRGAIVVFEHHARGINAPGYALELYEEAGDTGARGLRARVFGQRERLAGMAVAWLRGGHVDVAAEQLDPGASEKERDEARRLVAELESEDGCTCPLVAGPGPNVRARALRADCPVHGWPLPVPRG